METNMVFLTRKHPSSKALIQAKEILFQYLITILWPVLNLLTVLQPFDRGSWMSLSLTVQVRPGCHWLTDTLSNLDNHWLF